MAKVQCQIQVDSSGRELISHGTQEYPLSFCHDDLGKNEVAWHWHEEFEAVIVSCGTALVAAGEERHILSAGEGFFVNSGVLHGCWDYEGSGSRFHSLVFDARLVGGAADSVYYRKYLTPLMENRNLPMVLLKRNEVWREEALEHIERVWQLNDTEAPFFELESRERLSRLLASIVTNCSGESTKRDERALRQGERMKRMLSYIDNNLGEKLSVADIAASASISESECLRCFRDSINTTPIQYLRLHRIQRSAVMLSASEEKISAIAQHCGFDDMSYFTKIFRQIKGCSPSEYRRKGNSD